MNCSGGEQYLSSTPFKLVVLFQALLSILALIMLIGLGLLANIFHSTLFAILQGTHSYLMFTARSGCDILVPPLFCNILRIPAYWAIMCFGIVINVMVIERFVATLTLETYESISTVFGAALCITSVLSGIVIGSFTVKGPIAKDYVPYCTLLNLDNARDMSWWAVLAIALELLVVSLFIALICVNKKMEKNLRYNVKIRFQVRENLSVFRTLAAWIGFYFATLLFMTGSTVYIPRMVNYEVEGMTARTILAANNVMPIFCVVSPVALEIIYKREQMKRRTVIKVLSKAVTTEQYHNSYTAGWK